jgi:chemotaxis protein MotB
MDEEDPPIAIPEWVVTFGDMMSLLLTFFIMLVSLSEMKSEQKYQALVESMRRQFGHSLSMKSTTPGDVAPNNGARRVLATVGRGKDLDTHSGGVPEKGTTGDQPLVRIIRPGQRTATGGAVQFRPGSSELTAEAQAAIDQLAELFAGKAEKIEIRGHSDAEASRRAVVPAENVDLGYLRARKVMEYLANKNGVDRTRFRIASAGDSEPMHVGTEESRLRMNARVEVFLLDEVVMDLQGTPEERDNKLLGNPAPKGEK